jgi:hypothetical protein
MLREKNSRESDKKESGAKRKLRDGQERQERKEMDGERGEE